MLSSSNLDKQIAQLGVIFVTFFVCLLITLNFYRKNNENKELKEQNEELKYRLDELSKDYPVLNSFELKPETMDWVTTSQDHRNLLFKTLDESK